MYWFYRQLKQLLRQFCSKLQLQNPLILETFLKRIGKQRSSMRDRCNFWSSPLKGKTSQWEELQLPVFSVETLKLFGTDFVSFLMEMSCWHQEPFEHSSSQDKTRMFKLRLSMMMSEDLRFYLTFLKKTRQFFCIWKKGSALNWFLYWNFKWKCLQSLQPKQVLFISPHLPLYFCPFWLL